MVLLSPQNLTEKKKKIGKDLASFTIPLANLTWRNTTSNKNRTYFANTKATSADVDHMLDHKKHVYAFESLLFMQSVSCVLCQKYN